MKYTSHVVVEYPCGRLQTIKHGAPWAWLAKVIGTLHAAGTLGMTLAGGGRVIDVYVTERVTS